jgi:hypothetical protein
MKKGQTYRGDWLFIGVGLLVVVLLYTYGYLHFAN